MNSGTHVQHYHPAIRVLHWLIAALLVAILPLGFLQLMTKGELYHTINLFHVNLGFTLLLLMLVRLGVRLRVGVPPPIPNLPRWQVRLAAFDHRLLYGLLILQPFLGLAVTDTQGFPLKWLELIPIWAPVGESPARNILLPIHLAVAWLIVAALVLHIVAALYHWFARHDGAMARITRAEDGHGRGVVHGGARREA